MKEVFFVVGPESSGTRMMTQSFCNLGIFGDYKHKQRVDSLEFDKFPDKIVFRRSLPHGINWPAIADTVVLMRRANYEKIYPIVIVRDKDATIASQIRHAHAKTTVAAKNNIQFSINFAFEEFAKVDLIPNVIYYEPFVKNKSVRDLFYKQYGLEHPNMEFHNANSKYEK